MDSKSNLIRDGEISRPFIHFCENPQRCEDSEGTFGSLHDDDDGWSGCGVYYCPYGAPEHLWHDGCPSCWDRIEVTFPDEYPKALVDLMLESAGEPIPDFFTYPAENGP